MTKLVIYPIGGGIVHMRCEHHAPPHVREWLRCNEPPGFIHVQEVPNVDAQQRCYACLTDTILAQRPELRPPST